MKKRIVFISLPMNGIPYELIRANIERAKKAYLAITGLDILDVEFVDTMNNPEPIDDIEESKSGLWYLGYSLLKLSQCDEAFFWLGWKKARGCMIEREACTFYNIRAITVEDSGPYAT